MAKLKDWIQDAGTSLVQTGGKVASEDAQWDGVWTGNGYYQSTSAVGAVHVYLTSTFTFSNAVTLTKVVFYQDGSWQGTTGYIRPAYIRLHYEDLSTEYIIGGPSDGTAYGSIKTVNGTWAKVAKIEMYIHAYGDGLGGSIGTAVGKHIEIEAWGPVGGFACII